MWQRNAILLIGFLLLAVPVSAVNITSTHTYSHIQWHWDSCGSPSLIDNITVDNYPICNFNMSYQDFLLVGLDPLSYHYINITCEGNSTLSGVTTDTEPVYMTVPPTQKPGIPIMPSTEQRYGWNYILLDYWWVLAALFIGWLLLRKK